MRTRPVLAAAAFAAAGLFALAGCATSPAPAPTEAPSASQTPEPAEADVQAVWLDQGRMIGIVTVGSSTCVPVGEEVMAEGQDVSVTLADEPAEGAPDKACTTDMRPRASIVGLPDGVDPREDVTVTVTLGETTGTATLTGRAEFAGVVPPTDYQPSAAWFGEGGIVLLTWGSSSCPPLVDTVEDGENGATVTFRTEQRMCTMDIAPRATVLGVGGPWAEGYTLTMVGDNLDGAVAVLGQ